MNPTPLGVLPLPIPGCYLLDLPRFPDDRGYFSKLMHAPTLARLHLETHFVESNVSLSHQGVIRGMHFQLPPYDHVKMVTCLTGRLRDGLLDLRRGSPTYGQSVSILLDENLSKAVYIARGVAHGIAAHKDNTRLLYYTTSVHAPPADAGIHLESAAIDWWEDGPDISTPIISPRDVELPLLDQFDSPFVYVEGS